MSNDRNVPEVVMTVGIPASGKSSAVKKCSQAGYLVLSSDKIRFSILGEGNRYPADSAGAAALNRDVFETVRVETVSALSSGRSVIIDATNLNRKRRIGFLANLGRIPCYKKCMLFITPREVCIERNSQRKGAERVPAVAMDKMFRGFECPGYWEGWDEIEPVLCDEEYRFPFEETVGFAQDNPHHSLTLFEHLDVARRYAVENGYDQNLQELAYYHDIGKLYSKTFTNMRGEATEFAHFYGHENYGAYLYLTEKCSGKTLDEECFKKILYNTNLINCHMRPLNAWIDSPSTKRKDEALYGEAFVRDVELLNRADRSAH